MFDPTIAAAHIKPRRKNGARLFAAGHLSRLVLEILRHDGPMDRHEVARVIMARSDMDTGNKALCRGISERVRYAFQRLHKRRLVARESRDGVTVWRT